MSPGRQVPVVDLRRAYPFTLGVEMMLVVTGLVTLRLAADAFGTTGFGEFSVARRAVSVAAVPLLLGTGVALTRYVAYHAARAPTYLLASVVIVTPVLALFALGTALLSGPASRLLFGSGDLASLVPPTVLAIVGVGLHAVAYSYHAGHLRMGAANTLQLIDLGLAPVLAIALSGGSVGTALVLLGSISGTASLVSVAGGLARAAGPGVKGAARELLGYGVPRVPGDLAHFALFSVPTIVVAHRSGIEAAGFVSFALSLVHLIDAPFAVGRTLLLPTIGRLAAEGRTREIRELLRRTVAVSALAAIAAVAAVEIALEPVIRVLLGPAFAPATEASRWMLLGAVPYALYSVMRGAVDALAVWPHNSVGLVIALGVALVLLVPGALPAEAAVPLAFAVLAALTLRAAWTTSSRAPATVPVDASPSLPE